MQMNFDQVLGKMKTLGIGSCTGLILGSHAWAGILTGVQDRPQAEETPGLLDEWRRSMAGSMPQALRDDPLWLPNWKWLGLLALCLLAVIADRLMRLIVVRVAARVGAILRLKLNPGILRTFERPMGLLAGALTFRWLLPVLGLLDSVLVVVTLATSFVAAAAAAWAAYRLVDVLCDFIHDKASQTSSKFDDMLVPLARRTLKIFVVVFCLVFLASRLSEDLWSIMAGLGLGSLALGFAAKDSFENLLGTFTVLLDKPFQIGDWVLLKDVEGSVELVGFRSTRIRTFYNSVITVPNREFVASIVDNMGERRYRRIKTQLSLTYDTPPEKIEAFCEGIREIIRSHPYMRKDYYHVYLNQFGASSLDVLLYCFVETPEWATELRERHRLFADILRLAEELKVSFAFPTQTIQMQQPEDLLHPDRPERDSAGASLGREAAHRVVQKSMQEFGGVGAEPPAPVQIPEKPQFGSPSAP